MSEKDNRTKEKESFAEHLNNKGESVSDYGSQVAFSFMINKDLADRFKKYCRISGIAQKRVISNVLESYLDYKGY